MGEERERDVDTWRRQTMKINTTSYHILLKREMQKRKNSLTAEGKKRAIDRTCLEDITIFILYYAIIYLSLSLSLPAPFDGPGF